MPRQYTVSFENVAVTVPQDLLYLAGAAGKIVKIKKTWVGAADTTLVTAQSIRTNLTFLPASVSIGSGGSTPSIIKVDPGDAAASFTVMANNTTTATSNGTATTIAPSGDHIYAGSNPNVYTFAPGTEPVVGPSEALTFRLLSTVSGTVHLTGGMLVEESGG